MPLWLNTHLCPLISSKAKRSRGISLLYVTCRKRGYIPRPHVSLTSDSLTAPQISLSVPLEEIPSIHLVPHIIQHLIIAVRNDSLALLLELLHIIHHQAAEKSGAIFQRRLVMINSISSRLTIILMDI